MTGYVAPAARVFTVARIPSGASVAEDGTWPQTKCGLVMEMAEFWLPVSLKPGDSVCAFCADPVGHKGAGEQGMLL